MSINLQSAEQARWFNPIFHAVSGVSGIQKATSCPSQLFVTDELRNGSAGELKRNPSLDIRCPLIAECFPVIPTRNHLKGCTS